VPCEELHNEPHFLVSVVKFGKDPNITNSPGTVVQVTCSPGYGLNVANATAKCVRGEWKPATPECQVSTIYVIIEVWPSGSQSIITKRIS